MYVYVCIAMSMYGKFFAGWMTASAVPVCVLICLVFTHIWFASATHLYVSSHAIMVISTVAVGCGDYDLGGRR